MFEDIFERNDELRVTLTVNVIIEQFTLCYFYLGYFVKKMAISVAACFGNNIQN